MGHLKKLFLFLMVTSFIMASANGKDIGIKNSFRCGSNSVSIGAHKIEVQSSCGEPMSKEIIGYTLSRNGEREYKIEDWVYGPKAGYYSILTFEGGTLVKVKDIKK